MIHLDDECKRRLVNALNDRVAVTVAYTDRAGDAHISFYGSVHAHSDDQLGLWVRNPDGELMSGIARNPKVAVAYADIATRTFYRMNGRARVVTDAVTRDAVFTGMHPFEQQGDAERKGVAIVIDLDAVGGRAAGGTIDMKR